MSRDPQAPDSARALIGLCVVGGVFGVTFGLSANEAGIPWTRAGVLSWLAFSGAGQFASVAVLVSGGTAAAALAVSLVLGARFAPMSMASATRLGARGWRRVAAAFVLTDPSVLALLGGGERTRSRRAFWLTGGFTLTSWTAGTVIGAVLGERLRFDPRELGLDVALPALLLGLSGPALRDRSASSHLLAGGVLSVAAATVVPVGTEVLLGGLVAAAVLSAPGRPRRAGVTVP